MELEGLLAHCLAKPGATESHPFGPGALVMKVGGKIFAIIAEDEEPLTVSLKCEPEIAMVLRESYDSVRPGYHLNKRHWNTVTMDGTVQGTRVLEWVDDSYDLVVDALPRSIRDEIHGHRSSPPDRGP
jgi:predicted DNA-binding protein (MmcQ/YjbR family)